MIVMNTLADWLHILCIALLMTVVAGLKIVKENQVISLMAF
jgi:hypothetical protein